MRETSKCHDMRLDRGDFDKYIIGDIIDIGSGNDPIMPISGKVRPWDVKDGDGMLLASILDNSVDCVYSSHCLEHLKDIEKALTNWVRVLKPGGHLYFTIPDFIIYEKGNWPSNFNRDHKFSFSLDLTKAEVGRQNHIHVDTDLVPMLQKLNCQLISAELEDNNFDYNDPTTDQTMGDALSQICIIAKKL